MLDCTKKPYFADGTDVASSAVDFLVFRSESSKIIGFQLSGVSRTIPPKNVFFLKVTTDVSDQTR